MTKIELTIGGATKRSKFTPKAVAVEWENLPEASQDFIIRYGLKQYLADGAAGAEAQADFDTGIAERLTKLQSGDLTRSRGESKAKPDSEDGRTLKLIKDDIRKRASIKGVKIAKEKVEEVAKVLLADADKSKPYREEAKRQLASEAKLGASDVDDILGDLFADEGETEEAEAESEA